MAIEYGELRLVGITCIKLPFDGKEWPPVAIHGNLIEIKYQLMAINGNFMAINGDLMAIHCNLTTIQ